MLNEAITLLRNGLKNASSQNFERNRAQLEELDMLQQRSATDRSFWNVGTTCPWMLNFPSVKVEDTPNGRLDAFERALTYKNLFMCTNGRGTYSINNREEFLNAAVKILQKLAARDDHLLKAVDRELQTLAPLVPRARELKFWDVGSTCPR